MTARAPPTVSMLEQDAEAAYARMYDAHTPSDATAAYSDAKEAFADAIGLAERNGDMVAAERLRARLAHVKAVFRSQFT